jgi:hypothetical protein
MQAESFKKLILPAVGSIAALSFLLFLIFSKNTPFGRGNSSFAPDPGYEITSIVITDGTGELNLQKNNGKWTTGSGNDIRKNGITFLTSILEGMKIKSPVSEKMFLDEVTLKGLKPVKVRIYEKNKLLKSFYVYRTPSNIYGNIMKIRPGSKPFILYLPGFNGDIGSVFTVNKLYWEPYVIFNYLPSEILSVSVEHPSDSLSSFRITADNGSFSLEDGVPRSEWDSVLVNRYISYFTYIPFDEWVFEMSEQETSIIENAKPLYIIRVDLKNGDNRILTLWEKTISKSDSLISDSNRLYGKIKGRDQLFIVRYFDIDPILKKKSYFNRH